MDDVFGRSDLEIGQDAAILSRHLALRRREMPRGAAVRYFLDDQNGNIIAVSRGEVRVLQEIGTKRRAGRKPKAEGQTDGAEAQPKRRGRPRKKKEE